MKNRDLNIGEGITMSPEPGSKGGLISNITFRLQ